MTDYDDTGFELYKKTTVMGCDGKKNNIYYIYMMMMTKKNNWGLVREQVTNLNRDHDTIIQKACQ